MHQQARPLLVTLAIVVMLALTACGSSLMDAPAPADPLRLISSKALSERLQELSVYSAQMQAETRLRILLPTGYDAGAAETYPVLYLLHGCCNKGRGYAAWTETSDVEAFTRDMRLIVVMPEGGDSGAYSDWYNAGRGGPPRWESYHIKELLPWIEQQYRGRQDRRGRLLMGASMGGHGAFAYAAKYPQLFGSAAAISPSIDTNTLLGQIAFENSALTDGGEASDLWGPRQTEEVRWRGHNPWDLAENLGNTALFIRSGDGRKPGELLASDLVEIAVHQMAVNMHQRLDQLGIAHHFDDAGAGLHTAAAFEQSLHLILPQQLAVAQPPASEVRHFSYRSIEPAFSVFGWQVTLTRQVIEFVRLGEVSEQGFKLSGSGRAKLISASWYLPNRFYDVEIDGQATRVFSDALGRLSFDIDLGPPRSIQEYRAGSAVGYLKTVSVVVSP